MEIHNKKKSHGMQASKVSVSNYSSIESIKCNGLDDDRPQLANETPYFFPWLKNSRKNDIKMKPKSNLQQPHRRMWETLMGGLLIGSLALVVSSTIISHKYFALENCFWNRDMEPHVLENLDEERIWNMFWGARKKDEMYDLPDDEKSSITINRGEFLDNKEQRREPQPISLLPQPKMSIRSPNTRSLDNDKLVIAGKLSVKGDLCNIAQLNLGSKPQYDNGEWSERVQFTLYNSYSGGEVYYLLSNHSYHSFLSGETGDNDLKNQELGPKPWPRDEDSRPSETLIVVGAFDTTSEKNQVTYCSVGAWDGTQLSKVGEGLCNSYLSSGMKITTASLAGPQDVYVAGSFKTEVWNGEKHHYEEVFNIAHYNSAQQIWKPLSIGQITCSWCTVTVLALAWDSIRKQLHVAGKFNAIDGKNIPSGLAIYDEKTGRLVAHPGGGLTMFNETQNGVATALQLNEKAGILYVMGSFQRLGTGQFCSGLAAYEIDSKHWTCLADAAHTVMPSGGGNMLLTPFGLMVAGRTATSTTWPNSTHPYTIALLKEIPKQVETKGRTSNSNAENGGQRENENYFSIGKGSAHYFQWSWLPGFDGHDEPLHALANGYGKYENSVFIAGANFIVEWYQKRVDIKTASSTASGRPSLNSGNVQKTIYVPTTVDLSHGRVRGAIMAIAQLNSHTSDSELPKKGFFIENTLAVYFLALGALLGMLSALLCNKSVTQAVLSFFVKEANTKGMPLDVLTCSAIENNNIVEAYERAMKMRFVEHPHLLTLIDPQEIILHNVIGEGTFGRVWSAKWKSSTVAVKEFVFAQAAVAGKSKQQREIIEEIIGEAGMMAILRHPNVLNLFGCSLTAQAIWIVSELCSLGSLRQLLDDKQLQLPLSLRLKIALQISEAMTYLHNQEPSIIHRDLKSHNIFIHETFTETADTNSSFYSENSHLIDNEHNKINSKAAIIARIGDWGSARATLSGSRTMTHGVGTACWLAPEVIKYARSSKFSDVYGYGIILWELATREEVYKGLESTQIIAQVANDNLRPPIPQNCPWSYVMVKCWSEIPEDRYTFEEIVRELNTISLQLEEDKNTSDTSQQSHVTAGSSQNQQSLFG